MGVVCIWSGMRGRVTFRLWLGNEQLLGHNQQIRRQLWMDRIGQMRRQFVLGELSTEYLLLAEAGIDPWDFRLAYRLTSGLLDLAARMSRACAQDCSRGFRVKPDEAIQK